MKNILLKGMHTMPSEHEAVDGELSLAINLVAHAGELHPRQISTEDDNLIIDSHGETLRRRLLHQGMTIAEHYDDNDGYRYLWRTETTETTEITENSEITEITETTETTEITETESTPADWHTLWHDGEGRQAQAITAMGDVVVFAFDDEMVYFLFDKDGGSWHHLRLDDLRYQLVVDQREQRRVTLRTPVDSSLQRYLSHADEAVSGQATLLRHLFAEWQSGDVATGATLALARMEQLTDREMSRGSGNYHKHVRFVMAALRLFDGSHILMSTPFVLAPAGGEPVLTVETDGEEQMLCTATWLHRHTVKASFTSAVDTLMAHRMVQGIDLYQSGPMTLLDLCGAATAEYDDDGMATRLTFRWADSNTLLSRLEKASFRHVLHIALADFGKALVIPRDSSNDTLDVSHLSRHRFGSRVLQLADHCLCAADITQHEDSAYGIMTSYLFHHDEGTAADHQLWDCLCGECPDTDGEEEGLTADVVSVVHLRQGVTATTRTFVDSVAYPLAGILAYPDRRAFAIDQHLRFTDSSGTHCYRRSVSLRPLGDSGMAVGLWSGLSGSHAPGRHAVHSMLMQQARRLAYDGEHGEWQVVSDLWTAESADEWTAAAEAASSTTHTVAGNMLCTSKADNPLKFPLSGYFTTGDGTITALTPRVKRYGGIQFGQYPLYAFCTDGVWALQRGDDTAWRGKYQVSRYPCIGGQPAEDDDSVVYLSTVGPVRLDGSRPTRLGETLGGEFTDTTALPYFSMMMNTLFGEHFSRMPVGRMTWDSRCRLTYDMQRRELGIMDPSQPLHAVCALDSNEWSLAELGSDGEENIPVVMLTRPVGTPTHEAQRWQRVRVCGLFRRRCGSHGPLLCTMLWGSNDQYHWHLVGSSRCEELRCPAGSPWRWYRVAVAGWMAPDERIKHIYIEN